MSKQLVFLGILAMTLMVGCKAAHKSEKHHRSKTSKVKKSASVPAESASAGAMMCVNGADKRSIENRRSGAGCEVAYTKAGETRVVADAKADLSYCDKMAEKIKSNLIAAGFSCQ
ncbi:MAG: hypothetical protein COV44_11270 [Deltaproteobacteria bacterium CG11_big_fil_rev_8_21_14_0_20_45_16]|nr:MAG: hypothetical protein COV44_11270 [Deltaproteobacteria bacterium CG11_big_fil_rev_8_21_14_0_20_45_16]